MAEFAVSSPAGKFKEASLQGGHFKGENSKGLLRDSLELVKTQSNGGSRYTIKALDEKLSFDKGFYVFIRAIQMLVSKNKGVVVVGLAGPSGAGKSVFSEKVSSFIPGSAIISMDMYNDASRIIDSNFDDPRLTDYDLLLENVQDLRDGKSTKIPIYDFKESRRSGYREQEVPKSRVVIIEGIYALSTRIRPLLDLRVSITGGVHFDLVKRVLRDISRSGQAPEEIIQQISDTVYPMYKAYIEPDLKTAHLRIYNTFNPFSGFMNATYILKSAKPVSKAAIKACLKADHIYKRESEMYDIYLLPPGEDPETCQSWLRMRNRDGRYDLRFEEWVTDGPFVISPRISFEVSVRILGGLMALGYEIGTIMKRTSVSYSDDKVTIKLDDIEGMERQFVQIQGKERELVAQVGKQLGLDGTYIARSYIEQIQLEKLTEAFQNVPEGLRRHFSIEGEPLLDDSIMGQSPTLRPAFRRTTGFALPERPSLASSAPVAVCKMSRTNSANSQATGGLLTHQIRQSSDGAISSGEGSRRPSVDLDFAFDNAENRPLSGNWNGHANGHMNGHANGHFANGQLASDHSGHGHLGNGHYGKPEKNGMVAVEKLVQTLADRMEELAQRPDSLASQLDVQIQVLATQQEALNAQVQGLAKAVEHLEQPQDVAGHAKDASLYSRLSSYHPVIACAGGAFGMLVVMKLAQRL